jgi:hypothetical protein
LVKKERNLEFNYKDARKLIKRWPYGSDSIDNVNIINVLQFLTPAQRIHFVNELHRVMKKGSKAQIIAPHWCSSRALGDLAFVHPPIAEAWFPHLNAEWRKTQAPWGKQYRCDFDHTLGYGLHPGIVSRNPEYQQNAVTFWKEAAQDIIATLIKR